MVSDQYIENIQDIAIFWNELPENSAAAKSYLRIVYLTDDSDTWKVLLRDDGEGNPWEAYNNYNYASTHGGTGVAGYNNHVAFAGNVQGNAPKADGDFATNLKGKNARIIKTSTPEATSTDFYNKLGEGGKTEPLANGHGTRTTLPDGSIIVHRLITSTPGSPAVDIKVIGNSKVKSQKIHFVRE